MTKRQAQHANSEQLTPAGSLRTATAIPPRSAHPRTRSRPHCGHSPPTGRQGHRCTNVDTNELRISHTRRLTVLAQAAAAPATALRPSASARGPAAGSPASVVVTPLSKYAWILARHSAGEPCTINSSTTESGIAASAALRSPGLPGVPHRPQLVAPAEPFVERGIHGHVQVGGDRVLAGVAHRPRRSRSDTRRCGHTISFSSPPAASFTTPATVVTSVGDNQLMIAPSASRPARRSMPSRNAATRIGGVCSGRTPSRKPCTSNVS